MAGDVSIAMIAGAAVGSSVVTLLLCEGIPTESYMILAWLGIALYFLVAIMVLVPL